MKYHIYRRHTRYAATYHILTDKAYVPTAAVHIGYLEAPSRLEAAARLQARLRHGLDRSLGFFPGPTF